MSLSMLIWEKKKDEDVYRDVNKLLAALQISKILKFTETRSCWHNCFCIFKATLFNMYWITWFWCCFFVQKLKGYFSDLVLHFDKVGRLESSRGRGIWTFSSHSGKSSRNIGAHPIMQFSCIFSLDLFCLVNMHAFQTDAPSLYRTRQDLPKFPHNYLSFLQTSWD